MARTTLTVITSITDRDRAQAALSGPFATLGLGLGELAPEYDPMPDAPANEARWNAEVDEDTATALLIELELTEQASLALDLGDGHWAEIPLDAR